MAHKNKIISQSEAAKILKTSRQTLNNMFRRGNSQYSFFTEEGKIDISHPDWSQYIEDRELKKGMIIVGKKIDKKKEIKQKKIKTEKKQSKKKIVSESKNNIIEKISNKRDHALTGGFDPSNFKPSNPTQLKALTDVVAKNLEMRIKLGELISREIVDSYIDKISQNINQFVYLGRSVSTDICEKLDRIGMEREIEKIINPKIKNIIEQIIKVCNNAKK